jgi:hypothetical protein
MPDRGKSISVTELYLIAAPTMAAICGSAGILAATATLALTGSGSNHRRGDRAGVLRVNPHDASGDRCVSQKLVAAAG